MAESTIEVTAGSGTKIHAWSRTVGANTVLDEVTLPGEYHGATYTVSASGMSTATASSHLLQIMAGSSLNVYIRRIRIEQLANATTAALNSYLLIRLSSAGTGGTSLTPAPLDTSDSASGATAMTLPSAKGTETTEIRRETLVMRQAFLTTATQPEETITWEWLPTHGVKALRIPAGTSNGICVKNGSAVAAGTVIVYVEFVELSY